MRQRTRKGRYVGPCPSCAIPAEAAAVGLLKRSTLEPSPAHRANGIEQTAHLTPGKIHPTRPTAPLPANRHEQTGGDPGADPPGGKAEPLANLIDGYQDVIARRVHGPTLSYGERPVKTGHTPFCYPTSHNTDYGNSCICHKTASLLRFLAFLPEWPRLLLPVRDAKRLHPLYVVVWPWKWGGSGVEAHRLGMSRNVFPWRRITGPAYGPRNVVTAPAYTNPSVTRPGQPSALLAARGSRE